MLEDLKIFVEKKMSDVQIEKTLTNIGFNTEHYILKCPRLEEFGNNLAEYMKNAMGCTATKVITEDETLEVTGSSEEKKFTFFVNEINLLGVKNKFELWFNIMTTNFALT